MIHHNCSWSSLPVCSSGDNACGNSARDLYVPVTQSFVPSVSLCVNCLLLVASYACGSVDGYAYSNGPARLKQPTGIALDSTMNMLYIADFGVATVRQLNLATGYLLTVAGIGLRLPLQIHSFNHSC